VSVLLGGWAAELLGWAARVAWYASCSGVTLRPAPSGEGPAKPQGWQQPEQGSQHQQQLELRVCT
jgi:hypothetical protein